MRTALLRRFIFGTIVGATAVVSVVSGPTSATDVDEPSTEGLAIQPLAASESLAYTPISPTRILDTREGLGATLPPLPIPSDVGTHPCLPGETDIVSTQFVFGSDGSVTVIDLCSDFTPPTGKPPLQGGKAITLDVAKALGRDPGEISAVVMNVTVDQPSSASFLAVWPSGQSRPNTSNLNFGPGQTVANLVTVKVDGRGRVDIFNRAGFTHVIADVVGYHAPTSDFVGVDPDRILDTRSGVGAPARQVGPAGSIDLQVTGRGGIPDSGVGGVVMNVTATNPTQNSFGIVFPAGETRPVASNVNYNAGVTVPNLVMTKLGAGGKVTLFNRFGSVDFLADVVGYFRADATYVPLTPDRILDTREGVGARAGAVGPNSEISLKVLGTGGIPASGVRAVVMNVTSTESSSASFITVYPNGESRPTASSINLVPGKSIPNLVVAKVGSGGRVKLFNRAGTTHMIADVLGYIDATAGVDLPTGMQLPASIKWSTATWTVNSATVRERADDESFRVDDAIPFILDISMRVRNDSRTERQRFTEEFIEVRADGRTLPTTSSTFLPSLAPLDSTDVSLEIPIDWGTNLKNLSIRLGGTGFDSGRLPLNGGAAATPSVVGTGNAFSGVNRRDVCGNRIPSESPQTISYVLKSSQWRTDLPAGIDAQNVSILRAPAGSRWLVMTVTLDGTGCFGDNIFDRAFRLDVDGSFVASNANVNEIVGESTGDLVLDVVLAYEIPLDAKQIDFFFGTPGGTTHAISTAKLK